MCDVQQPSFGSQSAKGVTCSLRCLCSLKAPSSLCTSVLQVSQHNVSPAVRAVCVVLKHPAPSAVIACAAHQAVDAHGCRGCLTTSWSGASSGRTTCRPGAATCATGCCARTRGGASGRAAPARCAFLIVLCCCINPWMIFVYIQLLFARCRTAKVPRLTQDSCAVTGEATPLVCGPGLGEPGAAEGGFCAHPGARVRHLLLRLQAGALPSLQLPPDSCCHAPD
jgi:hypothetical protein